MISRNISVKRVLMFALIVFFNIFSFPLLWSIGANVLFLFILLNKKSINAGSNYIGTIIRINIILVIYTFLICMINNNFDTYTFGKPLRLLFVVLVFSILSTKLKNYSYKEIGTGLGLALCIHLACVYIQFLFPDTKSFFYSFLDSEKEVIDLRLRSFGLCTSFDASGLYLCVLITLLWISFKRNHSRLLFVLCFASFVSCFIVSRFSMIISSIFMVLMLISLLKNDKKFAFFFVIPILAIGIYYIYGIAQSILLESNIEESYRHESIEYLLGDMLQLPPGLLETLLGTGSAADNSDIGYVNIIYMIGILGLSLVLSMYFNMLMRIKTLLKTNKDVFLFMLLFLLLLLVFNYKLLLLYARGINDIFILLSFIIIRKQKNILYENNSTCSVQ